MGRSGFKYTLDVLHTNLHPLHVLEVETNLGTVLSLEPLTVAILIEGDGLTVMLRTKVETATEVLFSEAIVQDLLRTCVGVHDAPFTSMELPIHRSGSSSCEPHDNNGTVPPSSSVCMFVSCALCR